MASRKPWHKVALAVAALVIVEAGARIAAPGVRADWLSRYLDGIGSNWLISLYDQIGGGGVARGGVVALGVMPYLSARIMMRLARLVSPTMEDMSTHADGRHRLRWWTRVLTVGLSLIQSYGLVRFIESIPNAVEQPGPVFVARTMLLFTGGAVVAMMLSEGVARIATGDDPPDAPPRSQQLGQGDAQPVDVRVPVGEAARL